MGPIIAICGPPGAGKSSLGAGLSGRLGCQLVVHDSYETFTRNGPDAVVEWIARGAPYAEIETPGLEQALRSAAATGPVVFDTPLGRAHPRTCELIDTAIWIECPPDLALARKVSQLATDVPMARAHDFLNWLTNYLHQYEQIVRPACEIQRARVKPLCEINVDAVMNIEDNLDQVLRQLGGR